VLAPVDSVVLLEVIEKFVLPEDLVLDAEVFDLVLELLDLVILVIALEVFEKLVPSVDLVLSPEVVDLV
jgi:hypothetical protein